MLLLPYAVAHLPRPVLCLATHQLLAIGIFERSLGATPRALGCRRLEPHHSVRGALRSEGKRSSQNSLSTRSLGASRVCPSHSAMSRRRSRTGTHTALLYTVAENTVPWCSIACHEFRSSVIIRARNERTSETVRPSGSVASLAAAMVPTKQRSSNVLSPLSCSSRLTIDSLTMMTRGVRIRYVRHLCIGCQTVAYCSRHQLT